MFDHYMSDILYEEPEPWGFPFMGRGEGPLLMAAGPPEMMEDHQMMNQMVPMANNVALGFGPFGGRE